MMEEPSSDDLPVASTVAPSQLSSAVLPTRQEKQASEYTAIILGWILRGGAIGSAVIMLMGMLLLISQPGAFSDRSLQVFPHTLSQVALGLLTLQPQAIIALGLLLLIATPVVSVAMSVVSFALEHDRRFVIIALIVLAILLVSFFIGKAGG